MSQLQIPPKGLRKRVSSEAVRESGQSRKKVADATAEEEMDMSDMLAEINQITDARRIEKETRMIKRGTYSNVCRTRIDFGEQVPTQFKLYVFDLHAAISEMPYHLPNGTLLEEPIVGIGRTGLVLRYHGNVVKIVQAYRNPCASSEEKEIEDIFIEQNDAFLENEKDVYRRLGDHEGIVNIITISDQGIEMAYMENGSLFHYLQAQEPRIHLAVSWILKLAETVSYVHSRSVVIGDLTSRNVLLDKEMSVQLCDFSDAGVMPPCIDMSKVQHYGLSVKTDKSNSARSCTKFSQGNLSATIYSPTDMSRHRG